ncbi:MAG: C45 family autoproteolytic acyltransferase/hydrolase, partial [Candidatus Aminicenantes bacterium]|nr:C45 family autoproteolytic acyltransferase/hydrolase [Candidatus Aminicenantes bacterium]
MSSKKGVLPPDILPVVILRGSDYEMGYQYGKQAGSYIEKNRDAAWADALERFSRDEVIHALKANQHYIQRYTPEWIDFMKGMAAGANAANAPISYTDILLLNCTLPKPETSTYPEGAEKENLPPKKCSVSSAWGSATKDGRLIGMDTLDGGEDALFGVIIVAFPDKGNSYMCAAQAGEIGDHFLMNNKGLFLGNSGGGPSRDIDDNYGLAWGCSLPYLVRFSDNAVQARDMVLPWQINTPENFHFVDVEGNAFVVEKTAAVQAVRKSGDFGEKDFLYSTNNYLHQKMKITKEGEFVKQHGGYGTYAAPRNMMLWDMLHNYSGRIDEEFVKMMLRFPGDPPPYPPAEGWDAKVCRPTNSWVSVVLPDHGDEGIAHICTGPAGRVIHSSTAHNGEPMRSTYRYIDGTHTFFSLQLAADPKAVAKTSQKAAQSCIADAYREFMRMKITDQGFTAVNDLYSLANTEYFQGNDALNKAILADKDEKIYYFS